MIRKSMSLLLGVALAGAWTASAWAADEKADDKKPVSITGKVVYDGKPPPQMKINPAVDAHCAKEHAKEPLLREEWVVGKEGGLAHVLVIVKSGLPNKEFAPPKQPAILDQQGCKYTPHVVVVQVGQPLKVINSDDTNHNVHGLPEKNQEFNFGQPKKGMTKDIENLTKPEVFRIKCDVHAWMGAWAHVVEHPFWSVTNEKGEYAIKDLPAGEYEIEFFHEGESFKTQKVKVEDGKPTKVSDVKHKFQRKPARRR